MVNSLSVVVAALRCAESPASSIPSFIFLFSMAALFYKILFSTRSRFLRRLTTSPLWNLMIILLLLRTVIWWMRLVGGIDYIINNGRKIMASVGKEALVYFSIPLPDLEALPPIVHAIFDPAVIKMIICTLLSFVPLLVLFYIAPLENTPYQHIIAWVDHRWNRNEIGSGVYFLERPVPQERNHQEEPEGTLRASTGSLHLNRPGSSRLRPSQSV